MKKLFTFLAILVSLTTFAQAPEGFNYQATVRNSAGTLITNKSVDFTFKIIKDSPTGSTVYSETRTVMTDDLGAVNLAVGKGTPTVGTFSTINWGSGNYYLGIELNTGSGNVAMGTTQLLSVPYALYAKTAGTTQNIGRVTISITGNKTNAQVAQQIAEEFGPLTENVLIFNTTGLTTVDLSSLTKAQNINISNNSDLTVVNLNGVQYINQLTIKNDPKLKEFNATSLKDLFSELLLAEDLPSLITLNLPLLASGSISIESMKLTSLNFPELTTSTNLRIANTPLTSLTLPKLTSGNVSVINSSLNSLNLLLLASGTVSIGNSSLTSLNLPKLVSGKAEVNNAPLTSLNLPLFTSGVISVRNTALTSLSLPVFTTALSYLGGNFDISYNTSLTSISIPVLTTIQTDFMASQNKLPSSEINKLLNQLDTKATFTGDYKNLYLNQTSPAPPTGQGLVNKQSLINKGINVMTD